MFVLNFLFFFPFHCSLWRPRCRSLVITTCGVYITAGQTRFEITKLKGKDQKLCYSPNKPWQKPFIWIIISAFQCFSLKRLIFNNGKYTGKKEGGRCSTLGFPLFHGNHMLPALVPRWDMVRFCVLD